MSDEWNSEAVRSLIKDNMNMAKKLQEAQAEIERLKEKRNQERFRLEDLLKGYSEENRHPEFPET